MFYMQHDPPTPRVVFIKLVIGYPRATEAQKPLFRTDIFEAFFSDPLREKLL